MNKKILLTTKQHKFLTKVISDRSFTILPSSIKTIIEDGYYYSDNKGWLNSCVGVWKVRNNIK